MKEQFAERSAGIWFALVFYLVGGAYMLAFWGILDQVAYHLAILGLSSIIVGFALYMSSRWAFWIALFTFPVYFAEFIYGAVSSVNFVGWVPDTATGLFQASMIVYVVFLCFSFVLVIDKRNTLRSDRALDSLGNLISQSKSEKTKG
jgi:hypothetical protein